MTRRERGDARLLKLANLLDKLPEERFNFMIWVGSEWGGAKDLSCGTAACALGWATTIPAFRRLGLVLDHASMTPFDKVAEEDGHHAAMRIFHLTEPEARYLFIPNEYLDGYGHSPDRLASATEVAVHIRGFVASHSDPEHLEYLRRRAAAGRTGAPLPGTRHSHSPARAGDQW